MKTHTAYIQVPCTEPPKESSAYITDLGALFYSKEHKEWSNRFGVRFPTWWLEKREGVIVMTKEEFSAQENVINNAIEAFDFVHNDCKPKEESGYCDFFNLIMNAKESLKDLLL